MTISRGQLANIIAMRVRHWSSPYEELLASLPDEEHGSMSMETRSQAESATAVDLVGFRADLYTLFKIDLTRGAAMC